MTFKYTADIFFRYRAVTTHRAHNSKAARALRRATSTRAGRSGPDVPDVLLDRCKLLSYVLQ